MRGTIHGIKYGQGGKVLTVHVYDPWPPFSPDYFRTEAEREEYHKEYDAYEQRKNDWEHLRLGHISFEYVNDSKKISV